MLSLQMEKVIYQLVATFIQLLHVFFWDSAEDEMVRSANTSRLDVYHD